MALVAQSAQDTQLVTTSENPRKRKPVRVLEEDEYIGTMEKIIQRDYFPALPSLERVLTGQRPGSASVLVQRADSSARMSTRRRRDASTPAGLADDDDDDEWERDEDESVEAAAARRAAKRARAGGGDGKEDAEPEGKRPEEMTLSEFMATHTSEDNASFQELNKQRRKALEAKYWWIKEQAERHSKLLLKASDPAENPEMKGVPLGWEYKPRNELMFYPSGDDVPQLAEKTSTRGQGPQIKPENTRFPGGFFDAAPEDKAGGVSSSSSAAAGSGTPMVGGYKFMRTPSPAPGAGGESPMMTWGDVVGTPLHLEVEDVGPGPEATGKRKGFRVPATPGREDLAWRMADKAKASLSQRSRKATGARTSTPSSVHGGATPARLATVLRATGATPVGLRGALTPQLQGGLGDFQLRASYSPSPSIAAGGATPRRDPAGFSVPLPRPPTGKR